MELKSEKETEVESHLTRFLQCGSFWNGSLYATLKFESYLYFFFYWECWKIVIERGILVKV